MVAALFLAVFYSVSDSLLAHYFGPNLKTKSVYMGWTLTRGVELMRIILKLTHYLLPSNK